MLVTAAPDDHTRPWEATVSVGYRGTWQGRVVIRIYGEVLPALTANMLGEEGMPGVQLQRDALGEVANVICGNLLPAIAGTEVFDLEPPRVWHRSAGPDQPLPPEPTAETQVGLEDGSAEIHLYVTPAA